LSDYRDHDVIVIGGGHAGTEAARAAAAAGCRTLLLTHNLDTIGQMSCNPAIGGIGKGHIVREVDALGGVMALAADHAGIQFRTLNARKGPAVRATRCQADRNLYRRAVRRLLDAQPNLLLFQQPVEDLRIEGGRVCAVTTAMGMEFRGRAVVLTAGTFLAGRIHVGDSSHGGGRAGDPAAGSLAAALRGLGLPVGRLKTGTPPRLDARTIDFARLEEQPGDTPVPVFSLLGHDGLHPRQVSCHISATCERTHEIIRGALHRSPLYSGAIEGAGPRYCPSIEDKVVRFAERTSHQVFLEPEGLDSNEIYPNGISTSLPFDVQESLVRTLRGCEQARITRPGYAIEYDYFEPTGLHPWLETRAVPGLFLAGQINGTTGYEEAAGQGLLAGINAARHARGEAPWWPRRDQAYIGVMIDDLVTRGTSEPYRMFTSRAEYRLQLREDNADLRLTETGRELGVVGDVQWQAFEHRREAIASARERLQAARLAPGTEPARAIEAHLDTALSRDTSLYELLRRPDLGPEALAAIFDAAGVAHGHHARLSLEVEARYAGYLARQQRDIDRSRRQETTPLPPDLDFRSVPGLSHEVAEKLDAARPATVGQAGRIPGVTPAAMSLLLVHLRRRRCDVAA